MKKVENYQLPFTWLTDDRNEALRTIQMNSPALIFCALPADRETLCKTLTERDIECIVHEPEAVQRDPSAFVKSFSESYKHNRAFIVGKQFINGGWRTMVPRSVMIWNSQGWTVTELAQAAARIQDRSRAFTRTYIYAPKEET